MPKDDEFEAFANQMRGAMGAAIETFMRYSNTMYRDAIEENAKLKKRLTYLEQRVTELSNERKAA